MLCSSLKYVLPMTAKNFEFWYACNKLKGAIVVYTKTKNYKDLSNSLK